MLIFLFTHDMMEQLKYFVGTTDGPGEFDFTQGDLTGNPFWDFISGLLKDPSPEQEACHAPKPILLDTGEIEFPFPWHPVNIDTQIIRIGQVTKTSISFRNLTIF